MKKFKLISIIFLIICLAFPVLSGCNNGNDSETTTSSTTAATSESGEEVTTGTTVFSDGNYTYHSVVYKTEKATDSSGDEYTYAVIPTTEFVPASIVTTPKTTRIESTAKTTKPTEKTEATTKEKTTGSAKPIEEISEGVGVLTKTTPVRAGNSATITIIGEPEKKYNIYYYEDGSTPSTASGLEEKTANGAGFVSWTFKTSPDCPAGAKKIIIKEVGSDDFCQTSITIN